ncbi:MarR family winged helix-turn-helix transcriptional regulator [Papillibacter cinnamivorans]|uniref:DNA-binding transcriptional regulator, MarR family n=1 Tax=Papillibacter cinnamivorans DSM 12816 TaxID=1122930 RepID=A0A1W2C9V4_9FIRM|nr:MarR family winged helix-turn-helix transcriptional regulator [Papillibacter cinnamivorans]SMC81929.1 DNA-binding transcriptional regulator, MarR family [Papillibacter cinnamivorans DSM 12816]
MEQKKEKRSSVCNCVNLRRAAHTVTAAYDRALVPSGVKISQFSILKYIRGMAPVSVSDLARALRLDRTTLVRNLKPLEAAGLVKDSAPTGERSRRLELTDRGTQTLAQANDLWMGAQKSLEEYLGAEELNTLRGLLLKLETMDN